MAKKTSTKVAKTTSVAGGKGKEVTKPSKKKAAKGTKKAAPKAKADKKEKGDLNGSEVKVLKALAGGKELNRKQLGEKTGISAGWAKLLGANKDDHGVQGGGLAGKGLIGVTQYEGSRLLTYVITAAGKKAAAKAG